MDPRPLVSVVMAAYNCGRFIGEAIDSIVAQTYDNWELHIIDDGSTDDTERIVRRFAADPRVCYYQQANQGQTKAKNRGIALARGELVAFCDADDLWTPDKLALQVEALEEHPEAGIAYTRYCSIDESGALIADGPGAEMYKSGWLTEDLFKTNLIPFGTVVLRTSCLRELGPFDEQYRMGIDWELWLRLSTRYEFLFVDSVTQHYRIWGGQMSRDWRGRYDQSFEIMRGFLEKFPGLISGETERLAWADCFVNRARIRARMDREYGAALVDLGRALGLVPSFKHGWKSLGYVVMLAVGLRRA